MICKSKVVRLLSSRFYDAPASAIEIDSALYNNGIIMSNCENDGDRVINSNPNKRRREEDEDAAIWPSAAEEISKKPLYTNESGTETDTRSTKQKDLDNEYFKAYSEIDIHRDMLADHVRTYGYRRAILTNYQKFYKKVVLDLGCGTGILSIFCVHAGAKHVYAVEASDIAEQAKMVVHSNGMSDKITIIKGRIEDIDLPEKVDIIVSEWMGYMLLYEAMLPSVIYARDRWLNRGGYLFPHHAHVYISSFSDPDTYREKVHFWSSFKDHYSVDLSAIVPFAKKKLMERVHINTVMPNCLMTGPSRVFDLNLYTITMEDLKCLQGQFCLNGFQTGVVHGFVLWFIVDFPGNILLSTSPHNEETHWQQTLLYIDPFDVSTGSTITGSMTVSPSTQNVRFLNIDLKYQSGSVNVEKTYLMNDYI
ncbi:hypothetical protein CHUAL_012344 [Chamberlinius hualienensis]